MVRALSISHAAVASDDASASQAGRHKVPHSDLYQKVAGGPARMMMREGCTGAAVELVLVVFSPRFLRFPSS